MPSHDLQHRFLFDDCDIRGEIVTLSQSYQDVLKNNQYAPSIRNLLGEFLAAVSLLSSTLKFEGKIILQARGEGAISTIMAESSHNNEIRGIVRLNPALEISESLAQSGGLQDLLGKGVLVITLEPKRQGRLERYQGIVPMDAPHLAGCLEHYFTQSEQLATRLWFSTNEGTASGLLIQALPQQITDEQTNRENWETVSALTDTITTDELLELEHQDVLYRLFHEQSVRLFDPKPVAFRCSCSRDRSADALVTLGKDEIEQLLAERGSVDIDCHFCNQHYHFSAEEVRALFSGPIIH